MIEPKPGDTVLFTLTFKGVVHKVSSNNYIHVRTSKSDHLVTGESIVRVLDPEPDEVEVVRVVRCNGCGRLPGASCLHKQTGKPIKHPHKERVKTYIAVTGWTPNE